MGHQKTLVKFVNLKMIGNISQVMMMKTYNTVSLKSLKNKSRTMTILWIVFIDFFLKNNNEIEKRWNSY